MIIKNGNNDLIKSLRNSRRVTEVHKEEKPNTTSRGYSNKKKNSYGRTPYETFKVKYDNLEESIDSFKTRDFVYYFREVADEEGYKYTISNIKKDMAIFKRLTENYSVREICGMIEFLYRSPQNYLDKDRLSPNLLASQWINTIYSDMKLWVDDKYSPDTKKKKKQREWSEEVTEETQTKIGGWE